MGYCSAIPSRTRSGERAHAPLRITLLVGGLLSSLPAEAQPGIPRVGYLGVDVIAHTRTALGLKMPESVQARADQVVDK